MIRTYKYRLYPNYTSVICSVCGGKVPKTLADKVHNCLFRNTILSRDYNAAINILNRAGTARIDAWGEVVQEGSSLKQEALSNL